MVPSFTGTFTSPAVRPVVSVVIVWAATGRVAIANPAASVVTANSRRLTGGTRLRMSSRMTELLGDPGERGIFEPAGCEGKAARSCLQLLLVSPDLLGDGKPEGVNRPA